MEDAVMYVVVARPFGFTSIIGTYATQAAATRAANKIGYGAYTARLRSYAEFKKEMS